MQNFLSECIVLGVCEVGRKVAFNVAMAAIELEEAHHLIVLFLSLERG